VRQAPGVSRALHRKTSFCPPDRLIECSAHGVHFHVSLKHGKALYQNGFKSGRSWALSLFSPAIASEKSKTSFLIPLHTVEVMNSRAFSSEVDTGSREENAIKQRSRDVFRFWDRKML
jgi:hypothetical protein